MNELPLHLQRLIRTGRLENGSYLVSAQFRVTPKDEIQLRGDHLIEPDQVVRGEIPADWGGESAVVQRLAAIIHEMQDEDLVFGQTDLVCGEIRAKVPPAR